MISMERLYVVGGIMLLSVITLIFASSSSEHTTINFNNEAIITATAIGQSLLEEIQSRAFDENTVNSHAEIVDDLTKYNKLGPESGENNINQYDDIDDFNGYSRSQVLSRLDSFDIKVNLYYVSTSNPEVNLSGESFSKLISISISNEYLLNTLKFNKIVGY